MNDILLGAIIGGAIAAVVAWIQGHYSLKGKKEENLARQQQQSVQIQYDKNSKLISRIIEVRAKHLEPLSERLSELLTSMSDFRDELISVIVLYRREKNKILEESEISGKYEIQVEEAEKQNLIKSLEKVDSIISAIDTRRTRIHEAALNSTDVNLRGRLWDLRDKVYSLVEPYYEMQVSLSKESTAGHDFIYDFKAILELVQDVNLCISSSNSRIESLLAGADAGDE